ncbi:pseudouridine synthase [Marinobacter zhejiangensis]|uniref:Pseudouridine synthase n=1 Tax=Marinobacter zhejiangensis TaxID=488535 RepID=A0A1I4RID2_9GAMM|nr:pseudouridine synthase [Marinobacter zhejiangensis]SFM51670.1 23S rRNA pseudouridine2457 synthase [Marinobacter zhejiangensis]
MATLVLLNKPFQVMCQFTDDQQRSTLADYVEVANVYPAGRLDYDSEGLVLLTDDGKLQHRIAAPANKMKKTYWVQVEGRITDEALARLCQGVQLKDGPTRPAQAQRLEEPDVWPRTPPIRQRANQPTSWLELTLSEGRNRQVRRMTAAVGFPTLRLIRVRIGEWHLDNLPPGESKTINVHMPVTPSKSAQPHRRPQRKPHSGQSTLPNRRRRSP